MSFAKFLGRLLARFVPCAGLPQAKHLDPRVTPTVLRHTVVGWTRILSLALCPAFIPPTVATKLSHWFACLIVPTRRSNLSMDTSDVPDCWCNDWNLAVKHCTFSSTAFSQAVLSFCGTCSSVSIVSMLHSSQWDLTLQSLTSAVFIWDGWSP